MASAAFRQVFSALLTEHGAPGPGGTILDVGAKDGAIAAALGEDFDAAAVALDLAFDLDPGVGGRVHCVRADGRRMPFATDAFDAIVSNTLFEHVEDEERIIREAARVLQPDGLFVAIFPNRVWPVDPHDFPPLTPWMPRELGALLADRCMSRERAAYYRRYMHPVAALTVRREMGRWFGSVSHESYRLAEVDYEPGNRRGRLLSSMKRPLRVASRAPVLRRLVEAVFPVAVYLGREPRRR